MRSFDAGSRLGPYEIVGLLGAGGMGEVFRASDGRLGREVAIKVLPAEVADDPVRLHRFRQEALATAAINQPNILAIYDVGTHDGRPYLVSELLDGQTLRERLASGRLPARKALDYARQIAQGLRAAHAKGITHRDVKPENVFLTTDGRVKILDFGLARVAPAAGAQALAATTATAAGTILGTMGYMPPEQLRGQPTDARSDLFSLGVVLYEMLVGRRPFDGESSVDTVSAILTADPPRLGTQVADVPAALEAIVERCLQKSPEERFQSAADLEFALAGIATSAMSPASDVKAAHGDRPVTKRRWLRAGLVLLAVAIALGIGLRQLRPPPAQPRASSAGAAEARRVVAVLPFKNISRDGSQDYFAAGITEEIHGQLARIASLRLIGRNSVERLKTGDVRTLAAELGAGSIVEGSVRADRDRVRIMVELVDADTGQTMWSEQFDRELQDIFAVQGEIALRVAALLDVSPSAEERRRVERRPTQNLAAYDLYLRAEQEGGPKAIDMLREAVRLDPRFADAFASLAYRLFAAATFGDPKSLDIALDAAHQAVSIDPALASGHMALATIYMEKGLTADARLAFLRALDLNPNDDGSMQNLSVLESEMGRYDEALLWAVRAFRTSPRKSANDFYHAALPLLFLDEPAAERWLGEAERRFPKNSRIQIELAMLDARRNRMSEALARVRKLLSQTDGDAEALALASEVTYASGAPDAEAYTERLFRQAPDLTGNYWLLMESPRVRYAHILAGRGQASVVDQLLSEAMQRVLEAPQAGNQSPRMLIEMAAIQALRRQPDAALTSLERAYEAGMRDDRMLAFHPALAGLRDVARFRALVSRMRVDVSEMRRRADVPHTLPVLSAADEARPAPKVAGH